MAQVFDNNLVMTYKKIPLEEVESDLIYYLIKNNSLSQSDFIKWAAVVKENNNANVVASTNN
jgi:hypothetical protein